MKIIIDIEKCSECPHFESTPFRTADSWERAEYWWCKADDAVVPIEEDEKVRLSIKGSTNFIPKLRLIAGYVEWHDKTPIPEWCPCKLVK